MASGSFVPMEANPDVMNKFLQKLGVPEKWGVVDVMGIDTDMLAWVPRPVLAIILLYPVSKQYEENKVKEESEILSKGQELAEDLFFMKQYVSNVCGTVAMVHSVANNVDQIELADGPLKTFINEAKPLDPVARGNLFKECETILNTHKELSLEGQTKSPNAEDPVNHQFISFVQKDGMLYELDGCKAFPINHGPTTPDSLLEDTVKVCKKFMEWDPTNVDFTIIAFTAQD